MYISARAEYAIRAMLALAVAHPDRVAAPALAASEEISLAYLQAILLDLRRAGLLFNRRGVDGGYSLARPTDSITVGDILRATGGALTSVRGEPAERATYGGAARGLSRVWLAVDAAIHEVLDRATLADVLADKVSV
ncbi:Rrf2 family transcriptional regulator [Parafrankia sp. EUN1f]|uniref:RrF2 family transcriptional regulator n=1 Tax=Parafrankia sp. EUN1f TaxID=102897 RepID=UPI0001C4428F|nr:Rrf2 family transcriptional regulator [Parafrankia sp. EUN1f]EFC85374.1 transcriptional regulator, BadM/Rrf2 family [Parafrankia sp. EUN1f]